MNINYYYDEIDIDDMDFDEDIQLFTYPCPCGDRFYIYLDDIKNGKSYGKCPSCTLVIKIIYDSDSIIKFNNLMDLQK